ncbi:c-type cytochrome [Shewanella cyperi]|uniref:Cytochrome c5 family protein n=1 Tax=Shewanella cyperi TaxID=2814292 RepID=A0A974XKX9_9GAMM|nr:c-type cytochrome [Shewanella cyperi]QSX30310.1 cytochrome c5 family protein [Shewanella cyperi]QSX41088.1 cytochrome c5 family protein [Shewanella cyperi]
MKKLLAVVAVASLAMAGSVSAQEGKAVFEKACHVCHAMGVAGAPVAHDAAQWEPRLAKGIDALVGSVKSGLNAMPPGGMCTDCSDDDYKAAIEFMSK